MYVKRRKALEISEMIFPEEDIAEITKIYGDLFTEVKSARFYDT